MLGGSAASVLTVTFGLSYSLLIFTGPLSPYLSFGIAATFISSAVLAAVIALGSSLPFAIAAPDTSTAAMTGILAASLVERIETANLPTPLLSPILITLGLSTILTGFVLCGLGLTRMGRAIRYVPYPVVGGFLGATGFVIVMGAIRVITDHPVEFATLQRVANGVALLELGAACAMALVLYLTWHRSRSPFGLPIILIGGMLTAHLAFWSWVSRWSRRVPWAGPSGLLRRQPSCCPGTSTSSHDIRGQRCLTCSATSLPSFSLPRRARCSIPPELKSPCIAKPIWSAS